MKYVLVLLQLQQTFAGAMRFMEWKPNETLKN